MNTFEIEDQGFSNETCVCPKTKMKLIFATHIAHFLAHSSMVMVQNILTNCAIKKGFRARQSLKLELFGKQEHLSQII